MHLTGKNSRIQQYRVFQDTDALETHARLRKGRGLLHFEKHLEFLSTVASTTHIPLKCPEEKCMPPPVWPECLGAATAPSGLQPRWEGRGHYLGWEGVGGVLGAAETKTTNWVAQNNKKLFSCSSGGQKSQIQV